MRASYAVLAVVATLAATGWAAANSYSAETIGTLQIPPGFYYGATDTSGASTASAGYPSVAVQGDATAFASSTRLAASAVFASQPTWLYDKNNAFAVVDLIQSDSNADYVRPLEGFTYGHAVADDGVSAALSRRATGNIYLDATMTVTLDHAALLNTPYDPIGDAVSWYVGEHGVNPDPLTGFEYLHLGQAFVVSELDKFFYDTAVCGSDGRTLVGGLQCGSHAVIQNYASSELVAYLSDGGAYSVDTIDSTATFLATSHYDAGGAYVLDTFDATYGNDASNYRVSRNFAYDVEVLAGRRYGFTLGLTCRSGADRVVPYLSGNTIGCDATRSGYWNGFTDIRDLAGNPVSDLGLTSDSGFDYRYASPLSPAPAVLPPAATVPEPATWALLIAGFGMTGVAARRRRSTVAAA